MDETVSARNWIHMPSDFPDGRRQYKRVSKAVSVCGRQKKLSGFLGRLYGLVLEDLVT
jgi:hypothetical protein